MRTPKPKPLKTGRIAFRTTEDVKEKATLAAEAERRTLSQWIEGVVVDAVGRGKHAGRVGGESNED